MTTPKTPITPPASTSPVTKKPDDKGQESKNPNVKPAAKEANQQGQQTGDKPAPGSTPPLENPDSDHQPIKSQQQQGLPSGDQMKAKWKQYMGDAKNTWGKLTDDELLQSEGNTQKLAGLVEERYAISREAAHKQVEQFLKACHC